MKILTVSDVYFPRINGVSTSIATFHRELAAAGHETLLIAPDYGSPASDESGIVRIPSRRIPFDPEDRMMKLGAVLARTEALRGERFDLVHVQTPFVAHRAGVELGRRLGLPVVETYHTYFEQYLFHYVPFLPKALLRALARRYSRTQCDAVDRVIVPSTAMERALADYGVATPMVRIPTGLRMEELRGGDGGAFRRSHGIPAERPTLVHVGRVAHEKNIDFLLHVLAEVRHRVPDVLLVIAGEGPAVPHLRRLARDLALAGNVLFVGYLARESALLDCYRAGDLFVFASRTETQGLVLLEALALGVPVVSTAVMGTRDVLVDGEGALVAEDDVRDFSACVVTLLGDAARRRDLGVRAEAYARTWSARAMAERLVGIYREVRERAAVPARILDLHRIEAEL